MCAVECAVCGQVAWFCNLQSFIFSSRKKAMASDFGLWHWFYRRIQLIVFFSPFVNTWCWIWLKSFEVINETSWWWLLIIVIRLWGRQYLWRQCWSSREQWWLKWCWSWKCWSWPGSEEGSLPLWGTHLLLVQGFFQVRFVMNFGCWKLF